MLCSKLTVMYCTSTFSGSGDQTIKLLDFIVFLGFFVFRKLRMLRYVS